MSRLENKWFVFFFLEGKDASRILDLLWPIYNGSLILSRWHTGFDPLREIVTVRHLWVLFLSLPLPFWSKDILVGIENCLGHFVVVAKNV